MAEVRAGSSEVRATATDELRRLLDERGVEWTDGGFPTTATEWCANGVVWHGLLRDGTIELVAMLTPEQAVKATLGAGTCRITDNGPWGYPYVCSACGASFDPDVNNGEFNYCPNCGRKIKED